jgi:prepilin-type N-terminal cleavage/methylation domain-containing protein
MNHRNISRRPGKGFTLIELLVVIAVIALLLSILAPALSHIKKVARRSICLSNQHQCILACLMYANDNDEWLPKGNVGPQDDSAEIWTNTNFESCLYFSETYGLTEKLAMCSSWQKNIDEFFKDPRSYTSSVHFSPTTIGFIYYGRRYDKPSEQYSPKISENKYYKSPKRVSDSRKQITSSTLFSCYHWDSVNPASGTWGAKLPHVKTGTNVTIDQNTAALDVAPHGLAIGRLDASADWVRWNDLKHFEQNQELRIYYAP